ncbi:hypothetical protein [Motilimonas cestriensis]|nr:hypothetical protein [Motilimonas cestriensis]
MPIDIEHQAAERLTQDEKKVARALGLTYAEYIHQREDMEPLDDG